MPSPGRASAATARYTSMSPSFRSSSASDRDTLPDQSRALAAFTVSGISPSLNS